MGLATTTLPARWSAWSVAKMITTLERSGLQGSEADSIDGEELELPILKTGDEDLDEALMAAFVIGANFAADREASDFFWGLYDGASRRLKQRLAPR